MTSLKKSKLKNKLHSIHLPSVPLIQIKDSTFIQDFKNLMSQKESSDQIIEIDSTHYYIHKLIIKLRCPELFSLLEMNGKLSDFLPSSFHSFIEYIYTGSLSKENNLDELIQLSKKFQLDLLLKLCLEPDNINHQIEAKEQFKRDIKSLYNNPSHCDITFKIFSSKKEEIFKVHKLILIARSSWFRSFLSNQWKETTEGSILMKEIDGDSFRGLIEYFYTDTLSIENYNPDTFEICESLLSEFLEAETVLSLYEHCTLYGATQLQERCIYFMAQPECFNLIKQQKDFCVLEPSIQNRILTYNQYIEQRSSISKQIEECDFALQNQNN